MVPVARDVMSCSRWCLGFESMQAAFLGGTVGRDSGDVLLNEGLLIFYLDMAYAIELCLSTAECLPEPTLWLIANTLIYNLDI